MHHRITIVLRHKGILPKFVGCERIDVRAWLDRESARDELYVAPLDIRNHHNTHLSS